MNKVCKNCGSAYEVTDEDLKFYDKLNVPSPEICHVCREQKRLAVRNERFLYRRKCDLCDSQVVSMYREDSPYKQICHECFWGEKQDSWDAMGYGRDFDFNRSFFEQFNELRLEVPRINNGSMNNENCEYTNFTADSRNCYLTVATENSEDCYYCKLCQGNKNCVDCDYIWDSELCYGSVNLSKCFNCVSCVKLDNCSDCKFSFGLRSCKNCLFSYNLVNKEYCILNKQYSKGEYESELRKYELSTFLGLEKALKMLKDIVFNKAIHRANTIINCENCTGDNLKDCRNMKLCFDLQDSENCAYCSEGDAKFCYDCNSIYYSPELCVDCLSMLKNYFCRFNAFIYYSSYLTYCEYCHHSENLFGCVGLRRKKYCILNKQYSKEECGDLVQRIVEHMRRTGEWGQFFPIEISTFGYNETIAFEYYPLSKKEVLERGYSWKERDERGYQKQDYNIPDEISNVDEGILEEVLACEDCGKNFKIVKAELNFYKKFGIPIPRHCVDCRHDHRMIFRNSRILNKRMCDKCGVEVKTTCVSRKAGKVYCEECYLAEIY